MLRKCTQCGVIAHTEEELEMFAKDKNRPHGRQSVCKICKNAYGRKYNNNNPRQRKSGKLKNMYGITLDDYINISSKQDNSCAICKINKLNLSRGLFVDHCHTTGKVRGLLCHHCNTLLGYAKDNVEILSLAINYLNKHKEK